MGFEIHEGELKNISGLGFNHSIHRVKSTKSSMQIIHDEGFQSYSKDPLRRSSLARKNSFKFSYSSPAMQQRFFNLTNSALRMSRSKCDQTRVNAERPRQESALYRERPSFEQMHDNNKIMSDDKIKYFSNQNQENDSKLVLIEKADDQVQANVRYKNKSGRERTIQMSSDLLYDFDQHCSTISVRITRKNLELLQANSDIELAEIGGVDFLASNKKISY